MLRLVIAARLIEIAACWSTRNLAARSTSLFKRRKRRSEQSLNMWISQSIREKRRSRFDSTISNRSKSGPIKWQESALDTGCRKPMMSSRSLILDLYATSAWRQDNSTKGRAWPRLPDAFQKKVGCLRFEFELIIGLQSFSSRKPSVHARSTHRRHLTKRIHFSSHPSDLVRCTYLPRPSMIDEFSPAGPLRELWNKFWGTTTLECWAVAIGEVWLALESMESLETSRELDGNWWLLSIPLITSLSEMEYWGWKGAVRDLWTPKGLSSPETILSSNRACWWRHHSVSNPPCELFFASESNSRSQRILASNTFNSALSFCTKFWMLTIGTMQPFCSCKFISGDLRNAVWFGAGLDIITKKVTLFDTCLR